MKRRIFSDPGPRRQDLRSGSGTLLTTVIELVTFGNWKSVNANCKVLHLTNNITLICYDLKKTNMTNNTRLRGTINFKTAASVEALATFCF
jgi:hypothetical protein